MRQWSDVTVTLGLLYIAKLYYRTNDMCVTDHCLRNVHMLEAGSAIRVT